VNTSTVFGIHAVRSLLQRAPARLRKLIIDSRREDARIRELLQLAQAAGLKVERADAKAIAGRVGDVAHQGVIAEVEALPAWQEADLLQALTSQPNPLVLLLDGVQDPHNLGACLRTADATGALAVVIPKDRAVQLNATVRKVAAGAAETTPLAVVTNLARTLRLLKDAGLWIVGADAEAPKLAHETDLAGPIALVMGAEGSGLRQLTRDTCDFLVRLPQQGSVESLNVSVATGMLLYEALRQRISA